MADKFISTIETVGKDIVKGVEYPFVHTAQFVAVLTTAIKDQPQLQTVLTGLVQAAEKVVTDGGDDVASKGLDLTDDVQTVTDVKAFFTFFQATFLPAIESLYTQIVADVK